MGKTETKKVKKTTKTSTKVAEKTSKKVEKKPAVIKNGKLSKILRPGMMVKVLAGRDKDKTGKVLKVNRKKDRVIIEGVNTFLDNNKLNQVEGQVGRTEKNLPVHISNVMIIK